MRPWKFISVTLLSIIVALSTIGGVTVDNSAPTTKGTSASKQLRGMRKQPVADVPEPAAKVAPPELPSVKPYDTVVMSLADGVAVAALNDPDIDIKKVRWLSQHNRKKADRIKGKKIIDFTLNSFSRKRRIVRTAGLPNNVPDPVLIRVNLDDYGIDPKAWDELAEKGSGKVPLPDPYYHMLTKEKKKIESEEEEVKEKQILASSPILLSHAEIAGLRDGSITENDTNIGKLILLTGTKNPILRADWFTFHSWWAPAYYRFLGLDPVNGTEDDFKNLVKLDLKRADQSVIAGVADTKIVANHNRILLRYPTVNGIVIGYYWESDDTATGIDNEDYMLNLGTFKKPKIAAKELIATLLNTLQAYALTNDQGKLLSVAVVDVAAHSAKEPTKLKDPQVFAGRNCVFCHKEGIYPIKDNVRNLSQKKIAALIATQTKRNKKLADEIQDAFYPKLKAIEEHDQAIYTEAVKACNDLGPGENAITFEDILWDYWEAPITIERLGWEVGWHPNTLHAALKVGVNLDYTLTGLLQEPPVRPSILPWERQGFALLQLHLLSLEARAIQLGVPVDKMLEAMVKAQPK